MNSDVSIDNLVDILEYVSLCDSYINNGASDETSDKNRSKVDENILYERLDTHRADPSDNMGDLDTFVVEQLDTNRSSEDYTICTNSTCSSIILNLERKIRLLETQNSQLVINTCSLYNTLTKHIQSLADEIKKKDEIINNM